MEPRYQAALDLILRSVGSNPVGDLDCYVLHGDRNDLNKTIRDMVHDWIVDFCDANDEPPEPDSMHDWVQESDYFWDMGIALSEIMEFIENFDLDDCEFMDHIRQSDNLLSGMDTGYGNVVRNDVTNFLYGIVENLEDELADIFDDPVEDEDEDNAGTINLRIAKSLSDVINPPTTEPNPAGGAPRTEAYGEREPRTTEVKYAPEVEEYLKGG